MCLTILSRQPIKRYWPSLKSLRSLLVGEVSIVYWLENRG